MRKPETSSRSAKTTELRPASAGFAQTPADREVRHCRSEIGRLLPLWPHELADLSAAGRAHVLATIERSLRAERRRGLAGHWTYNLARHAQLLRAYKIEKAATRRQQSAARGFMNSAGFPLDRG